MSVTIFLFSVFPLRSKLPPLDIPLCFSLSLESLLSPKFFFFLSPFPPPRSLLVVRCRTTSASFSSLSTWSCLTPPLSPLLSLSFSSLFHGKIPHRIYPTPTPVPRGGEEESWRQHKRRRRRGETGQLIRAAAEQRRHDHLRRGVRPAGEG